MTSAYVHGAVAMRELAAVVADEQGQHALAACIRATPLPTTSEPERGRRVVCRDEDARGEVYDVTDERVAVRFADGRVRWLTPQMWRDDVNAGRLEVTP